MTDDMEIALKMAGHIINPCHDPREEFKSHNLRELHLRLAAEISATMGDGPAKDCLNSIIGSYRSE